MKKIFIIPGFKQKASDTMFTWLRMFLGKQSFDVVMVPITWDRRIMREYVSEFERFYESHKSSHNSILGFSYGAVIALISAQKLDAKNLYLCSLSADFKEDLPFMKKWIKNYLGKRRVSEIETRSGREYARSLTVPTIIFYGEVEGKTFPQLRVRCEETANNAKHAELVKIKGAPHDISHPEYKMAIKRVFGDRG
jgi:hypothetical protein